MRDTIGATAEWIWLAALSCSWGLATLACDRPAAPEKARSPAPSRQQLTLPESPSAEEGKRRPSAPRAASSAGVEEPACERPWSETPPPIAEPASSCPADPVGQRELSTVEITFPDAPGNPRVVAEHATTPAERERGLMYRTELAVDAGMLFTWPSPAQRSFWMKNTCLPLDMLFVDERGVIVNVLEQVPPLNLAPRRSGCPAIRVLEVNAGWTRANGIRPGQRLKSDG